MTYTHGRWVSLRAMRTDGTLWRSRLLEGTPSRWTKLVCRVLFGWVWISYP